MSSQDFPKAHEPGAVEHDIYQRWEASGFFNPNNLSGEPYAIMMPPPNVTGVLHLGHALENALMDTMARYQRMRGKKVLLVPGTDHAALPTQAKVEKNLMEQGIKNPRQELGREKLVETIRAFAEDSKATILGQIKKLGTSCDWSRLAYTFDQERNLAVNQVFEQMYQDGLVYRGFRVVNWSVKGQSTCSDDEVVYVERKTKLYTFKYSKDFPISIASTRPETKLGDTAVAVHPADKRYKKFIGQVFTVDVGAAKPSEIKIIADENVEKDFGTGALGVTPAHSAIDFTMYEKQKAAGTPIGIIPVIGPGGIMTAAAGSHYQGLTAEKAREKFVQWLRDHGLLEKEEEIVQNVGTSDRFGDIIETIPMTQWWLDVNKKIPGRGKSLKDLMREAVTTGLDKDPDQKVIITPDRFKKLYLDRIENLHDWCLSRQIWWGHRIPAWYKKIGANPEAKIHVGTTAPDQSGWVQDPDTLDTWFSSGLWTFSTLGWPEETKTLKTFHPTAWMQMGYEILYLWLMRMILMSSYVLKQIPFKDAYIHGMLRDERGKKFSKSAGNNIDPLDVIAEYGADALRWSVLIGTSPGNDSKFYEEKIEGAQHLVNKLWNIARFVAGVAEGFSPPPPERGNLKVSATTLADRWILSRLDEVVRSVTTKLDRFEFSSAGEELRDFTWGDFADWYLEIAKLQLTTYNLQLTTKAILLHVLQTLLKLWHPFMPFVTEEIWSRMGEKEFLMIAEWPHVGKSQIANRTAKDLQLIQGLVTAIRNLRATHKISPGQKVDVTIGAGAKVKLLSEQEAVICGLGRVGRLVISKKAEKPKDAAVAVVAGLELFVHLGGLVEPVVDHARMRKEKENLEKYIASLESRLGSQEFIAKAPPQVVDSERTRLAQAKEELSKISAQLD